jgi:uncharacterized membrane protein YfcA
MGHRRHKLFRQHLLKQLTRATICGSGGQSQARVLESWTKRAIYRTTTIPGRPISRDPLPCSTPEVTPMFHSRIFTAWFLIALSVWGWLFSTYCGWDFLQAHWHYPLIMVLGAFVAGLTPEGGGAVAFPVLNVFFDIDRVLARDFSLMIQSVGMTSASIFILTQPDTDRRTYRPLVFMLPVVCAGFVLGMATLQNLPVYLIQALFLSMITAFAFSYAWGDHRGTRESLQLHCRRDYVFLGIILVLGGMCASLFGTGADILLYSLVVTRFRMTEKTATRMSIIAMAATSLFGFAYRHFVESDLQVDQYKVWICAYPVVLFMAPFGAYILSKIHVEWMIKGIVVLNFAQLAYFNINRPSAEKFVASLVFMGILLFLFMRSFAKLAAKVPDPHAPINVLNEQQAAS